jgi:thiol:disulfide interchange protein
MQKHSVIFVLWIFFIAACSSSSQDAVTGKIDWVEDYTTGVALAAQTGKPIMLYFTADWCPPCKELQKNVFSRKDVTLASRGLINIYLDVDKDRATMEAYKVRSIPIIFFLDHTGKIDSTISADSSAKQFLKHMQHLTDNAKPTGSG